MTKKIPTKLKTYFNRTEREFFIRMMLLEGCLKDSEKVSLSPEERKKIRMAKTNLSNTVPLILDRLDARFAQQVIRDLEASELLVLPKNRAKIETEAWEAVMAQDQCVVSLSALELLAEKASYWCRDCKCADKSACELKNLFIRLDMPVYDTDQECPYEIVR